MSAKKGTMNDRIGKMPIIKSKEHALLEILNVVKDERSHFMLADAYDWLNLKMKAVGKLAKAGLKIQDWSNNVKKLCKKLAQDDKALKKLADRFVRSKNGRTKLR